MSFQGALEALAGTFIAFYLGCACVGRSDIPIKIIHELRLKALAGTSASWGCPSVLNKNACTAYEPESYR
jgi:hypothetical protein